MKKLLYLFLTVLIVACSGEDGVIILTTIQITVIMLTISLKLNLVEL